MESWFSEAKVISTMEVEVCFLIQNDFYYGPDSHPAVVERKEVAPLPSPNIARKVPSMIRTSEAFGYEENLANYYREVLRVARYHRKTFNHVRQYFWLRLWLCNTAEDVHVDFP